MQNHPLLFENQIYNSFNYLNEDNVMFDKIREKIKSSISSIRTNNQAKEYILKIYKTLKNAPKKIKNKTLRYVLAVLIVTFGFNSIVGGLPDELTKIGHEAFQAVNKKSETLPKAEPQPQYPTKASQSIRNFIKKEEGFRLKAYNIGDGKITIGWGHAEDVNNSQFKKGDEITKEIAQKLFDQDIKEAENGLNRILNDWTKKGIKFEINQDMYDAMVSMIFNMGIGGFRTSDFIQMVKRGEIEQAANEILTTRVGKYKGVKHRREKESSIFIRGIMRLKIKNTLTELFQKTR